MNISKLYQRAHALRMQIECIGKNPDLPETPPEFYVGVALGECIGNLTQTRKSANVLRRFARIRGFAPYPASWPDDLAAIWGHLLTTYGTKPRLLRAIADGMEA